MLWLKTQKNATTASDVLPYVRTMCLSQYWDKLPGVVMLKKITSVSLAVSFIILTVSGITMLISKELSSSLIMEPFHDIFAILMTATGIVHLLLNRKALISYFNKRYIKIIFSLTVGIIVILYIVIMRIEIRDKELSLQDYRQPPATDSKLQE
jgi:hypothetical protein